jgi:adenylate cyclase
LVALSPYWARIAAMACKPTTLVRFQRWLYARLGPRYPYVALAGGFSLAHLVVLGGVGLLLLYVDMSTAEFLRAVAISQALTALATLKELRHAFRLVRPAQPWLRGERTEETALAAWRALARLPRDVLWDKRSVQGVAVMVPMGLYLAYELDYRLFPAALIFLVAGGIVLAYGAFLRYFWVEQSMRPVLELVSQELPAAADLSRTTVSLRTRLLAALPIINVITGVVVAALSSGGEADLSALGISVLMAIAVAATVSFELSLLLARSVVEPIEELQRGTDRVAGGDFSVRVPLLGGDETGRLAASFNHMVAGLQEREALREAFGAFVDPVLAERVVTEGTILEGEEVEVSVLFVDIRGFTSFAESAEPRDVVGQLNEFYGLVVPVLVEHGGHANKFIGDGLLGVFGAPVRHHDHADRAVAAALEIARQVRETFGAGLRIGIGVNSGRVVAGTIGGGGRVDFTVIGDAVNTAARVESVTRETGDDVLITDATRRLLTRDFGGFVERGAVELRGKAERVRVLAPLAVPHAPALRAVPGGAE